MNGDDKAREEEKTLVNAEALYTHRRYRAWRMQHGHYDCARMFDFLFYGIGLAAIVLSVLAAKLEDFAIIGSILVAIVVALQTFLNSADKAAAHRLAGANFARIRDRLEDAGTVSKDEAQFREKMDGVIDEWDKVRKQSPNILLPVWIWIAWRYTRAKYGRDHDAANL